MEDQEENVSYESFIYYRKTNQRVVFLTNSQVLTYKTPQLKRLLQQKSFLEEIVFYIGESIFSNIYRSHIKAYFSKSEYIILTLSSSF